jgi:hypothetical protein
MYRIFRRYYIPSAPIALSLHYVVSTGSEGSEHHQANSCLSALFLPSFQVSSVRCIVGGGGSLEMFECYYNNYFPRGGLISCRATFTEILQGKVI